MNKTKLVIITWPFTSEDVGSKQELNGTWDLVCQMVTSWWPSKSIPNKNQNENVASFFQNLAIPLPHPPQGKKQRISDKLFHFHLGVTSLLLLKTC
jgi:hypothetical protein